MTTEHHFDKLVAAVTQALGPQTPLELRGEWPEDGGDNTPANTAEWRWQGHDVFVHAHDPLAHDEVAYDGLRLEVLVVITAVDPHTDFTDLAADDQPHVQQEQRQDALEQVEVQSADGLEPFRPSRPADGHTAQQQGHTLAQERFVRQGPPVSVPVNPSGQHNAHQRHAQGVGQADQIGHPVALGRVELKQALANGKACGLQKEIEAALNAARAHVGKGVGHQVTDGQHEQQDGQDLVDQAAKGLAAPGVDLRRSPPPSPSHRGSPPPCEFIPACMPPRPSPATTTTF